MIRSYIYYAYGLVKAAAAWFKKDSHTRRPKVQQTAFLHGSNAELRASAGWPTAVLDDRVAVTAHRMVHATATGRKAHPAACCLRSVNMRVAVVKELGDLLQEERGGQI